jgi:uncharacterized membrane protein YuzA (DUF378 family)
MNMKLLHMVSFILVIVGAINWGLVGLADFNLVDMVFGMGSMLAKLVYILVGVSGVYLFITHKADCRICGKK